MKKILSIFLFVFIALNAMALEISSFGPYRITPDNKAQEIYVEFSEPMISLSALKDQNKINESAKRIMSISPEIKGNYHWNGTKMLTFIPEGELPPETVYTVTVNKGTKSFAGNSLVADFVFSTWTDEIRIESYNGCNEESELNFDDPNKFLAWTRHFDFRLNYPFSCDRVKNMIQVLANGSPIDFSISKSYWSEKHFEVTIDDSLKLDSNVEIRFDLGKRFAYRKFSTKFHNYLVCKNSYYDFDTENKYYVLTFEFNQKIKPESVSKGFDGLPIDQKVSFEVVDKKVIISGISKPYGTELTVSPNYNIQGDGQLFKKSDLNITDMNGFVSFLGYGDCIMESQFPHKFLFQYRNVKTGDYSVSNDKMSMDYGISEILDNAIRYKVIDLDPFLNNGKGTVNFNAQIYAMRKYWGYEVYSQNYKNNSSITVTDLAATVRYGYNKAVVMVRSMEKNLPVKDAEVFISNEKGDISTKKVKTDKNGLAVISFSPSEYGLFKDVKKSNDYDDDYYDDYYDYRNDDDLYVHIKTTDDQLTFKPKGHSTWGYSVSSTYVKNALNPKPIIYMFSDRGVYKPGETVTFSGWDKELCKGEYSSYKGGYTASLVKSQWRKDDVEYAKLSGTTTEQGGFSGEFKLPDDLKPGDYCIKYKDEKDGNYGLWIQVAHFEPVKFQSSTAVNDEILYAGDKIFADVSATYLAGGNLTGAKYSSSWYYQPAYFRPDDEKYSDYYFGYNDYEARRFVQEKEGDFPSDGDLKLECPTMSQQNGHPYTYSVETYVTDISNQRISSTAAKVVHPAYYYVGIGKPLGLDGFAKSGSKLRFPFVLIGADSKSLSDLSKISGDLEYTLEREYWTYNYQNGVGYYVYSNWEKHVDTESHGSIKKASSGTLEITPKYSGWYTLKIKGKDSLERNVISEYEFYVSGSSSSWFSSDASKLKLTPDKSIYNPGDTAQVLMESMLSSGDYLVTVEREGIISEKIYHFDQPCNVVNVKIDEKCVPVVYVSVSTYSPRTGEPTNGFGETDVNKPKEVYGVTQLLVNTDVKTFNIETKMDKPKYRPGDTATVTIKATKGGKPVKGAEIVALAADRAVLDLINYHVPNPIERFYSIYNYNLMVKGGDSRNYLMNPVNYSLKNLQGGDADKDGDFDEDDSDIKERKNFKSTAFFKPSLITNKKGEVTFSFKVPDNLTTFRLTAVGVSDDQFSIKEGEFVVQNPVNVQSIQPRRLRIRDKAECGVLITNLEEKSQDVQISLDIRKASQYDSDTKMGLLTIPGSASIDGKTSYNVNVKPGESKTVYFQLDAKEAGNIELVYTVNAGKFKEKLVSKVLIEKSYCFETVSLSGSTEYIKNSSVKAVEHIQIPSEAKDGEAQLTVTLDATQLGVLGGSVNYLFDYPYGCMEQQSSRIIPLVAFDKYIDIFGLDNRVVNPRDLVIKYFSDWKKVQHANGGFPYWPDNTSSEDFFVSSRIAHIYAMALKRGYTPEELSIDFDNLKSYLLSNVNKASAWDKALCCYVFSMLGDSGMNSVLNSLEYYAKNNLDVAAYCGLAWSLRGDEYGKKMAKEYLEIIKPHLVPTLRSVDIANPSDKWHWYWNRSEVGQIAEILQFYVSMEPGSQMVDRLLYKLLKSQMNGHWQSTATDAKVLEAIYTLIQERKLDTTAFVASANLMSKEIVSGAFRGVTAKPVENTAEFKTTELPKDSDLPLEFTAKGTGNLYYSASLKYALPDELHVKRSEGIDVTCQLSELKSGIQIPLDSKDVILENGKTYKMVVKVKSLMDRDHVALRVPIPSGGEILDSTFVTSGSESVEHNEWCSSRYIYDNEIQYFFDDFNKGETTVEFTFRTARRGVYPVTPVQAECMYEPEVFGRSNGHLYTIK